MNDIIIEFLSQEVEISFIYKLRMSKSLLIIKQGSNYPPIQAQLLTYNKYKNLEYLLLKETDNIFLSIKDNEDNFVVYKKRCDIINIKEAIIECKLDLESTNIPLGQYNGVVEIEKVDGVLMVPFKVVVVKVF